MLPFQIRKLRCRQLFSPYSLCRTGSFSLRALSFSLWARCYICYCDLGSPFTSFKRVQSAQASIFSFWKQAVKSNFCNEGVKVPHIEPLLRRRKNKGRIVCMRGFAFSTAVSRPGRDYGSPSSNKNYLWSQSNWIYFRPPRSLQLLNHWHRDMLTYPNAFLAGTSKKNRYVSPLKNVWLSDWLIQRDFLFFASRRVTSWFFSVDSVERLICLLRFLCPCMRGGDSLKVHP